MRHAGVQSSALEADVLHRVRDAAPAFLARVVVDLLIAMSCDGGDAAMGGIDDTIREDTLGLKVPRRWRRPSSRCRRSRAGSWFA